MSLRPSELQEVARALDSELQGAVVQKVRVPWPERMELELRQPGRTVRLLLSVEAGLGRLSVIEARALSTSDTRPSSWLLRVRKELTGRRLSSIRCSGPRQVRLVFEKGGTTRTVVAELGSPGVLLLLGERDAPLAASRGSARAPAAAEPVDAEGPRSRLGEARGLDAGRAAEALVAARESVVRREAMQRARVQPIRSTLQRLRRTRVKVEAEAGRDAAAEEHRRWGELLSRSFDQVPPGARAVRLTEWTEEGPREVEVPLDPALAPRAQVERHFRQYRRLLRGSAMARERLATLDREIAAAERALAEAEASPAAGTDLVPVASMAAPSSRKRATAAHRPFRVFRSAGGQPIWVGRAGEDNAVLTFQVARPHHLWMHARGVPGAHVVVPLDRGEEVGQDRLLDAAHLALHFSRLAGEPRGDVAWTRARLVKRVKGGAPGQVTYTGEKVLAVRIEPVRLERLLRSREDAGPG